MPALRDAEKSEVVLERWGEDGLRVLEAGNTPEMTAFLGGPESAEQLAKRHQRAMHACMRNAAQHGDRDAVVASPRVDNAASNALCRTVGFRLAGEEDGEYPPGTPIRVNAWVLDLTTWRDA